VNLAPDDDMWIAIVNCILEMDYNAAGRLIRQIADEMPHCYGNPD